MTMSDLIEEILPSVEGEKYRRIRVDGEWFTVPAKLLDPPPMLARNLTAEEIAELGRIAVHNLTHKNYSHIRSEN